MRYYRITCHTPYVGEDNDYYVGVRDRAELEAAIEECLYENANEWYDEEIRVDYPDEDEYYAECYYELEEIDKEEYLEYCPWEREKE